MSDAEKQAAEILDELYARGMDAAGFAKHLAAAEARGRKQGDAEGFRRGVEEAAKVCDAEREAAWKSSRKADAAGNHYVGAADATTASAAQRLAEAIRALAPREEKEKET